jgi:hypothetical protein
MADGSSRLTRDAMPTVYVDRNLIIHFGSWTSEYFQSTATGKFEGTSPLATFYVGVGFR